MSTQDADQRGSTRWRLRQVRRTAVATVAALLVQAWTPAAVWASGPALMESSPRDDSVVQAQIDEVVLTFNVPIRAEMSSVVVDGFDGRSFSLGGVQVYGSTVHQPVYPLTSGLHTVEWQVYSTDGVRTSGQYPFTVQLPPGREPTAVPPPTALDAPHVKTDWPVVAVLAAAGLSLTVALWWAVSDLRRTRPSRQPATYRRP